MCIVWVSVGRFCAVCWWALIRVVVCWPGRNVRSCANRIKVRFFLAEDGSIPLYGPRLGLGLGMGLGF